MRAAESRHRCETEKNKIGTPAEMEETKSRGVRIKFGDTQNKHSRAVLAGNRHRSFSIDRTTKPEKRRENHVLDKGSRTAEAERRK